MEVSRHVTVTPGPDPPEFGMLAKDGNASNGLEFRQFTVKFNA